jgi:hypothetical protein
LRGIGSDPRKKPAWVLRVCQLLCDVFPCRVLAPVLSLCPVHTYQRGDFQLVRMSCLSCFRPLHERHIDCKLLMSWFGSPFCDAGVMWSIVQSPPPSSFSQTTHTGSKTVLAYALAFAQSVELCQSAICLFRNSPDMGLVC